MLKKIISFATGIFILCNIMAFGLAQDVGAAKTDSFKIEEMPQGFIADFEEMSSYNSNQELANPNSGQPGFGTVWRSDTSGVYMVEEGVGTYNSCGIKSVQKNYNKVYIEPNSWEMGGDIGSDSAIPLAGYAVFNVDFKITGELSDISTDITSFSIYFGDDSLGDTKGVALRVDVCTNGQIKYYDGTAPIKAYKITSSDSYINMNGILDFNTGKYLLEVNGTACGNAISFNKEGQDQFGYIKIVQSSSDNYVEHCIDNIKAVKFDTDESDKSAYVVKYVDMNSIEVDSLKQADKKIQAKFRFISSQEPKEIKLMTAFYDGNRVIDAYINDVTVDNPYSVANLEFDLPKQDDFQIKHYLWESIENPTPVAEPIEKKQESEAGTRKWWVYISPQDAVKLYNSPAFELIKSEADTYCINGPTWPNTSLDHASRWVYEMQTSQELLSAVYVGLKYGKYNGEANAETDIYLNRIKENWIAMINAGPIDMLTTSMGLSANDKITNHTDPPNSNVVGWYEGDIDLRSWTAGAFQSYDAIRDDISNEDREEIDRWLRKLCGWLWINKSVPESNRGMSATTQAHIIALILQDSRMFNAYFNNESYSLKNSLNYMNYPLNSKIETTLDKNRLGYSRELQVSDAAHGMDVIRHSMHGLATLAYVSENGGDASWNVYNTYENKEDMYEIFDAWYEIAGPDYDAFMNYCAELEVLCTGQQYVNDGYFTGAFWDGFAFLQPRFLEIGTTYGKADWTLDAFGANCDIGAMTVRRGIEALRKTRAAIFNGYELNPIKDSVWGTPTKQMQTGFTPQTGSFTLTCGLNFKDVTGRKNIYVYDTKPSFGGQEAIVLSFKNDSTIAATSDGVLTQTDKQYMVNTDYTLEVNIDVENKKYSAYLINGNNTQTLCENYKFDITEGQYSLKWWGYSYDTGEGFSIKNFSIKDSIYKQTPPDERPGSEDEEPGSDVTGPYDNVASLGFYQMPEGQNIGFEASEGYTTGTSLAWTIPGNAQPKEGSKWLSTHNDNLFMVTEGVGIDESNAIVSADTLTKPYSRVTIAHTAEETGADVGDVASSACVPLQGYAVYSMSFKCIDELSATDTGASFFIYFAHDSLGGVTGIPVKIEVRNNGQIKYYNGSTATLAKKGDGSTNYVIQKDEWIHLFAVIDFDTKTYTLKINDIAQRGGVINFNYTDTTNPLDHLGQIRFAFNGINEYKQMVIDNVAVRRVFVPTDSAAKLVYFTTDSGRIIDETQRPGGILNANLLLFNNMTLNKTFRAELSQNGVVTQEQKNVILDATNKIYSDRIEFQVTDTSNIKFEATIE